MEEQEIMKEKTDSEVLNFWREIGFLEGLDNEDETTLKLARLFDDTSKLVIEKKIELCENSDQILTMIYPLERKLLTTYKDLTGINANDILVSFMNKGEFMLYFINKTRDLFSEKHIDIEAEMLDVFTEVVYKMLKRKNEWRETK